MKDDKEIKRDEEEEGREEIPEAGPGPCAQDPCGSHIDPYGYYADPCGCDIEDPCCCLLNCR